MLNILPEEPTPPRHPGRESQWWHDQQRHTPSLGCTACYDRPHCGGLDVGGRLFDCLQFCCGKPEDCDAVCRTKPEDFANRVREVSGFAFENVPRATVLHAPSLPAIIPLLYHGSKRVAGFTAAAVCLPLYSVIERMDGTARFANKTELETGFGLGQNTTVLLSGTATDPPLERWWSMGSRRRESVRALRRMGIAMVTTPNYSLFIDQPRWDDLHNLKRIAIVHEEFLSEGMPAALHLNARTDRDWSRWIEYIAGRPEVTHVTFEFGTGAGWARRSEWHAEHLSKLAHRVGRPLHLIVRGGAKVLPALIGAFSHVSVIDTSVFTKTRSRQRALLEPAGALTWSPCPTQPGEPLDRLLNENWSTFTRAHDQMLSRLQLSALDGR